MSGYIGTQPVPQATQTRDSFTATANQTSFATSGYTPEFLDVFLNGVKLAAADYTATNGSDVVLASGATVNDILEVVAYSTFEVLNPASVLNGLITGADAASSDLIPVYDVSAGRWEKQTITNTALQGPTGAAGADGEDGLKGGGSDLIFFENSQNVTTNYTISNNKNAMSAGPITINSGVTVTIGDGETWTVV